MMVMLNKLPVHFWGIKEILMIDPRFMRLIENRNKSYGQIPDPEHLDLLIRLIPRRHVEVRALINAYKYENKRLAKWYQRIPVLVEELRIKEKKIAELTKTVIMLKNRIRKIIGDK